MNPRLIIELKKLAHNGRFLAELCNKNGITVTAVTKVFCAEKPIIEALSSLPIDYLGDSRLENIESYPNDIPQKTMLLRLPSPSAAERVVKTCDISLNSELITLAKLSEAAEKLGKQHGVLLMIDLGDLREGIYHNNDVLLNQTVEYVLSQKNLILEGFGTNLTCYGSVLPTTDNLSMLTEKVEGLRKRYSVDAPIISGGNSSSLYLIGKNRIPKGINNLRFGEAIARGKETAFGETYPGLCEDVVTLEAEIIEIAEKPSYPEGQINVNAFGESVNYIDKGIHKRAILAVGRQDTVYEDLVCLTPGIEIIGASSDHLIVDISNSETPLAVGDCLGFSLSYGAMLAGFTSKYVQKVYISN